MYRYGEAYEEAVRLKDGSPVLIRAIRPTDKAAMQEAYQKMTPQSQYERFMARKSELTEYELEYFTEFDGVDHFGLGAIFWGPPGNARGAGAGRFVRLPHSPDSAELAVTVVNEFQGKGLGTIIVERLLHAAWERGVQWFHLELLASNIGMRRLIESLSHDDVKFHRDEDNTLMTLFRVPEPSLIPEAPTAKRQWPLFRVIGRIARADITVRHRLTLPRRRHDHAKR